MYYLYIMHFNSDALVYICMFVCIYIRIYVYNTCFCQFQTSYLLCYSTHVRKCLGIPNPTSEDNKEHNDCSHHLIPSLLSLSYCMMNKKNCAIFVCLLFVDIEYKHTYILILKHVCISLQTQWGWSYIINYFKVGFFEKFKICIELTSSYLLRHTYSTYSYRWKKIGELKKSTREGWLWLFSHKISDVRLRDFLILEGISN